MLKILLPVMVLAVSVVAAKKIVDSKKEPERRVSPSVITTVEAVRLKKQDYQIMIMTRGTVKARTESTLTPEVSGRVVEISPNFREGAFFEKGDILLQIDPRDYEAEVIIAKSTLAEARQALAEEKARVEQALRNWGRLGKGGTPGDLVLRKPQLASAKANIAAAEARLERKKLDLERTRISAPYAGRVLEKNVDIGQFVMPGSILAAIYAVDYAEIRLPLSSSQLEFVDIPELYRGEIIQKKNSGPKVTLSARIGSREYKWQGVIVRAEGSIDSRSRQSFVVAQVDDPYGKMEQGKPPLKVGQFVEAEIWGHVLKDVIVISRLALREGEEVLIASDNKLNRRKVNVIWKDIENAIVKEGLKSGELLIVTPVAYAVNGTPVRVKQLSVNGSRLKGPKPSTGNR